MLVFSSGFIGHAFRKRKAAVRRVIILGFDRHLCNLTRNLKSKNWLVWGFHDSDSDSSSKTELPHSVNER